MQLRTIAVLAAAAGGVVLLLAAILSAVAGDTTDAHDLIAHVGEALVLVGIALAGWGTVEKAPLWLRVVVAVGLALLVAAVWATVLPLIEDAVDGWKGPMWARVLAGIVALAAAALYTRRQPVPVPHRH